MQSRKTALHTLDCLSKKDKKLNNFLQLLSVCDADNATLVKMAFEK